MKQSDAIRLLQTLNRFLLAAFLLIAGALVYWSVLRAEGILSREDNPRLVEAALRIQRGHILDRNNNVLAETIGPPDQLERHYPYPAIGPAVGYYSFRHGASGVEDGADEILRGETNDTWATFWRQTLHQPQQGRDVRLTLDADWQITADSLLPDRPAALVLLRLPNANDEPAKIRAMASHPGYDPNLLDERFEELTADEAAPLLNRAAQGHYQPGRVLAPFLLAAALNEDTIDATALVDLANRLVAVDGQFVGCQTPAPQPATWTHVLHLACPYPLLALGEQWGASELASVLAQFGLTQPPALPIDTGTAVPDPVEDPGLAAIGQDALTVTPLQVARALAALAEGAPPPLQLVSTVEDEDNRWQPRPVTEETAVSPDVISVNVARQMRQLLPERDNVLEHNLLVLSGPGGSTNAWYLGLAPAHAPRYAVVVVVEQTADHEAAAGPGRRLLTHVLNP